jgi:hypothetical protein
MAVGLPLKVTYADGDVYSASDVNDTNGTVNLLNPTAKGSLISASAANTPSLLAVGANNTVLMADSAETTGLKWATPSAGAVLQVKNSKATAFQQITSTSLVNLTNLSVAITPASTSNKVLVLVSVNGVSLGTGSGRARIALTDGSGTVLAYLNDYPTLGTPMVGYSLSYLDSPATVSSKTYKLMGLTDSGASFYVQNYQSVATVSTITVMEVTP